MFLINDKPFTAHEMIERYKIPYPTEEELKTMKDAQKMYLFRRKDDNVKILENGELYGSKLMLKPLFRGFEKGFGSVTIRYANGLPFQDNGQVRYNEQGILFQGLTESLNIESDIETYVFYYMHVWCKDSPVRQQSSRWHYEYFNPENASKQKLTKYHEELSLGMKINKMKDDDLEGLRTIVASLIAGASDMSASELELQLLDYAKMNFKKVQTALDANDSKFHGMIQLAIERNILQARSINDIWRWHLIKKDGTEEEICIVPMGENHLDFIKKDVRNNYETKMLKVVDAINGYKEADRLDIAMKNLGKKEDKTLQIVEELVNDGILYLERSEKSVYFVVDDKPEKFIELSDVKGWVGEVAEICKKGKSKDKLRSVYDKYKSVSA
jgi:hypothetical protein